MNPISLLPLPYASIKKDDIFIDKKKCGAIAIVAFWMINTTIRTVPKVRRLRLCERE
jgi:hypothetical protein